VIPRDRERFKALEVIKEQFKTWCHPDNLQGVVETSKTQEVIGIREG
jgi:hypothetical protein